MRKASAKGGKTRGSTKFAGASRGGRERKGSASGDGPKLTFRKLNNADPGPKNT